MISLFAVHSTDTFPTAPTSISACKFLCQSSVVFHFPNDSIFQTRTAIPALTEPESRGLLSTSLRDIAITFTTANRYVFTVVRNMHSHLTATLPAYLATAYSHLAAHPTCCLKINVNFKNNWSFQTATITGC